MDKLLAFFIGAKPPKQERRALVRIPYKTAVQIRVTKGELDAILTDISPAGFRLEYRDPLKPGALIQVGVPNTKPLRCKVIWSKPRPRTSVHHAGLVFEDDRETLAASWVKDTLQKAFASSPVKERRKHVRMRAGTRAALANKSGDVLADGLLLDLSMGGALLALPVEFKAGTRVVVQIAAIGPFKALEMDAVVRSVRRGRDKYLHGMAFDNEFDPLVPKYLGILFKQYGKTVG